MAKPTKTDLRRRSIVEHFDVEQAFIVSRALRLYAAVQDVDDGQFPDPDKRRASRVAQELSEEFRVANAARDYLEGS